MNGRDGPAMPWLAAPLVQALVGPVAHALLVHGPGGVGQFAFAMALARAWLCEDEQRPIDSRPCGACAGCKLVRAESHPDLLVVLPQALREQLAPSGSGDGGDGDDSGSRKKPSKEIRVDEVRAANAFAATTASRGRMKVVVVHPAERMNAIAANAFLKTLEEPPGDSRFVLSTAAAESLLPTIRSRCRAIALPLPAFADALAWLEGQGIEDAGVLLAAAGGSPGDALARAEAGIDAAAWRQLPRRVAAGDARAFDGWPLPAVLDALQRICDDAARRSIGAEPRFFDADALPRSAAVDALVAWSRELVRLAVDVEHPWHAPLAIDALVQRGREALQMPRSPVAAATPDR